MQDSTKNAAPLLDDEPLSYLTASVADLEFSTRLSNILDEHEIRTVADIYGIDMNRFKKWKGVGRTTIRELQNWLHHYPDPRYTEDGYVRLEDEALIDMVIDAARKLNHYLDSMARPEVLELELGEDARLIVKRRLV